MSRVEHDAVEEALTEMWMANTLCLTFLVLNAIGFACVVWAVPVIARALAAQVSELGTLTATLLALGRVAREHPGWTALLWIGLSVTAVVLQFAWENRRAKIRLFAAASLPPLVLTLVICGAALLA